MDLARDLMAWIAVLTDAGEELARFELGADAFDWVERGREDLADGVPGLLAAIRHALDKDRAARR